VQTDTLRLSGNSSPRQRLRMREVVYDREQSAHFWGEKLQFECFDRAYLERLRSGDPRTQEHFVKYFSDLIRLKLRSRLHSVQAAEDIKQETFLRVLTAIRSRQGVERPESLGSFVNSICNHVLMEYYRSAAKTAPVEETVYKSIPDNKPDALATAIGRQAQERVREILEELPERDRRILREVVLEEKDAEEVCRSYGVNRGYLRVLLHRAKQSFKKQYLNDLAERTRRAIPENC
jgi:RNA polymerase sigma-70 factor (ECF subfamily)